MSKTPVIGKVPNMKPSWMNDNNGVWTYELNNIPDIVAEFIQNWLEDNINDELYEKGLETASNYSNIDKFTENLTKTFDGYLQGRKVVFESQLDKLKVEEEN